MKRHKGCTHRKKAICQPRGLRRERQTCGHLDLTRLASWTVRKHSYVAWVSSLWYFALAAISSLMPRDKSFTMLGRETSHFRTLGLHYFSCLEMEFSIQMLSQAAGIYFISSIILTHTIRSSRKSFILLRKFFLDFFSSFPYSSPTIFIQFLLN
jgi:hypothetical protein